MGEGGFCVYLFFCNDSGIFEIIFIPATISLFTLRCERRNVLKKVRSTGIFVARRKKPEEGRGILHFFIFLRRS